MATEMTLHEECYPVVGFQAAGIFEYGASQSIADAYAVKLAGTGRLIHPGSDIITDEEGNEIRDSRYNRIMD